MKKLLGLYITLGLVFFATLTPESPAEAATLSVTSSAGTTIPVGTTVTITINLDTVGANIQGVDLHYLKYDPSALEVQDENTSTSGVQIAPGTLMPNTVANLVNTGGGQINFSQITSGGQSYSGSGTLATVRFKVLKSGSTPIAFDFVLNNTTDSNVAGNGQDLLTRANGITLTLSSSAPLPPPSVPSGGGSTPPSERGSSGGGGGGSVPLPPTPTATATATPVPAGPLVYETNPLPGSAAGPVVIRKLTESAPDGARIPEGGSAYGGIIVFNAQLFDANNNKIKLEVELRQKHEAFTGASTLMSTYVNPGETARIERAGLVPGEYKFRARASNIKLEKSEWLEFGNSPATDFIIRAGRVTIPTPSPTPTGSARKPYPFTRTLRRGIKGPDVLALQNMLKDLGYNIGTLDGWYGLKALVAIKDFQQKQGLGADGIFGPKSQAKFNVVYAGSALTPTTTPLPPATQFTRTLRRGTRSDDVKAMQEKLNKLGFSVGTPDGSFGPKTFTQVKAFQAQHALTADGIAGPKTLEKLNSLAP